MTFRNKSTIINKSHKPRHTGTRSALKSIILFALILFASVTRCYSADIDLGDLSAFYSTPVGGVIKHITLQQTVQTGASVTGHDGSTNSIYYKQFVFFCNTINNAMYSHGCNSASTPSLDITKSIALRPTPGVGQCYMLNGGYSASGTTKSSYYCVAYSGRAAPNNQHTRTVTPQLLKGFGIDVIKLSAAQPASGQQVQSDNVHIPTIYCGGLYCSVKLTDSNTTLSVSYQYAKKWPTSAGIYSKTTDHSPVTLDIPIPGTWQGVQKNDGPNSATELNIETCNTQGAYNPCIYMQGHMTVNNTCTVTFQNITDTVDKDVIKRKFIPLLSGSDCPPMHNYSETIVLDNVTMFNMDGVKIKYLYTVAVGKIPSPAPRIALPYGEMYSAYDVTVEKKMINTRRKVADEHPAARQRLHIFVATHKR